MEMEVDGSSAPKGGEEKGKQIVVILVGPPGSGKSTFCERVIGSSPRRWSRICQDTINNGKAGTKPLCMKSAVAALDEGKSVFIDRCNLDKEQRADFMKLGGPRVDVHAVVLDLPTQLCISRSVKRTGHEGNLQGGKAAAVVNRMLQKKELPKLNEGFSRILFCTKESDVDAAIDMYRKLGPSENLLNGCFGEKKPDNKIQAGIMKFLKKVEPPVGVAPNSTLSKRRDQCGKEPESKDPPKGCPGDDILTDDIPALAFPSISTADFQFDNEKASDIIVEKVAEYVDRIGSARLVLVDLNQGSKILSLVKAKAAARNIDPRKFFTFVGDITRLYSQGGLRCNVIANAANWRLKPGGGGVNAAIYSAAGPALESATKERAKTLSSGHAVVVPLSPNSPLYNREGVSHVIHALGPNMNPNRPNCLNNNYSEGCQILGNAYSALFDGFLSVLKNQANVQRKSGNGIPELAGLTSDVPRNQMSCEQKMKRSDDIVPEGKKKCKGSLAEDGVASSSPINLKLSGDERKIAASKPKSWGSWAQALCHIAMHPEEHKDVVLEISDDVIVLNDLYPKAQKHLLVLARYEGLDSLADVHKKHLQLLVNMHAVGLKWAEKFLHEDSSMVFRLGYHSAPSMRQLHLHVISQDFNSTHMKNKKHWNSFNTAFFLDSVDVTEEVEKNGVATLKDDTSYLSTELRCHRCRSAHPNIPRLKSHISNCKAPFPSSLYERGCLVLAPSAARTGQ